MAVIFKTKSVIRQMQGIILLWVLFEVEFANSNPTGCDKVGKELEDRGLNIGSALRPETGPICGANSCCGEAVENNLKQYNRLYLDKYLRGSINKVSSLIETRAKKFDEFFKDMMSNSKREFHDMFERTYGKIYLQNSDVFSDFFSELETYYKKGSVRLSETMDNFFGILYQRMFTVINSQYDLDDKYLECVSEHMTEMKPFGDIPHKLGVQLRRSFVATRTFYKSLVQGALIADNLREIVLDEECATELTKMQHCGICTSMSLNPCADYCTSTLENCLRYHTSFSKDWDKYIDGLDKVADRLLGPFNIEGVVEPLNIKISEAVMNFQESGAEVSKKIHALCGTPTLSRRKRKTDAEAPLVENPNFELNYGPMKIAGGGKKKHKKTEKMDNTPSLKKLIMDIKTKIRETRQFWMHLPYQYCNNETIASPPSANGQCWNGTAIGSYEKSPPKATQFQSPIISEQNFTLQVYFDKLRKAHQGEEVELIDDSEEPLAGSGSGSGDHIDEEEEEDITPKVKVNDNNADVVPHEGGSSAAVPPTTTSKKPEVVRPKGGSSDATSNTMSLTRALIQYFVPIILVWFGGTLTEFL
ncbi:glypican-6 [Coccinella septempunctata]|uniref:glypican-6 n=1 Tax=Coccinella septempunctata TaxID=41139 RepID=UPI001D069474|nr:glypican-6 [Coccinella septempunctata]